MANHPRRRISLFWTGTLSMAVVYFLLKFVSPYLFMKIAGKQQPLPVPGTLMVIYMALAFIGLAVYVTTSEKKIEEFLAPPRAFLKGGQSGPQGILRLVLLGLFPLLVGWVVYQQSVPKVSSPTGIRIQHPTIPGRFEKLVNPYREPSEEMLSAFIASENLKGVSHKEAKRLFVEHVTAEGRDLYQINCRPCHGSKADGNGPMAWGFRLKPANFTDPGTIPTVVEAYVFWRINEGAFGLPSESSPWDSAMPAWKGEISPDDMWKIILADYDTAGVDPRIPEKLEH